MKLDVIYNEDCLEGIDSRLPKQSIDLIITDPPYFLPARHYNTRRLFKRNFSDLGILEFFFKSFFEKVDRVLKKDGLLYMFCDGQSYPLFYYYAYFIMKTVRPLIWDKKTSFNGYYWRHQHELILFGVRPEKHPIPTGDGDILRYSAVKIDKREHPAEKPVELIEHILHKTSNKSDIVLDPFIGSGAILAACKKLNRHYIGFDTSSEYCEIARKKLSQVQLELIK